MRRALARVFFPPACPLCGSLAVDDHRRPCPSCAAALQPLQPPWCPRCGRPQTSPGPGHHCPDCLKGHYVFASARALFAYAPPLADAIHRFKYRRDFSPLPFFARAVSNLHPAPAPEIVVPVPLSTTRLRQRGFNQSLLLARGWFGHGRTAATLLQRIHDPGPQTGRSGEARRRALAGTFALGPGPDPRNRRILVVDDVFTTGATVNECCRVLLRAGAATVQVLTLARTVVRPTAGAAHQR